MRSEATVARTARPRAPPTCWVVLTRPEARPGVLRRGAGHGERHQRREREAAADAEQEHRGQQVDDDRRRPARASSSTRPAAIERERRQQHGCAGRSARSGERRRPSERVPIDSEIGQEGGAGADGVVAEHPLQVEDGEEEHAEHAGDHQQLRRGWRPATLRERRMPSRSSGRSAVAWRQTNAASSATASAPSSERVCVDDRVDAEHQRAGDEDGAGDVGARAQAEPRSGSSSRSAKTSAASADRHVDEEDPVPVQRLGEYAADQQADRRAGGGDEAEDADRLRLLARRGEHRHDHAEDHGGARARRRRPGRSARRSASPGEPDSPHSSEASVKTARPARKIARRPIRSPSRPASSSRPPNAIR